MKYIYIKFFPSKTNPPNIYIYMFDKSTNPKDMCISLEVIKCLALCKMIIK